MASDEAVLTECWLSDKSVLSDRRASNNADLNDRRAGAEAILTYQISSPCVSFRTTVERLMRWF